MFKKIKKTIQKDLQKRYEQLEERFLVFERRLYSHLEERLEKLENQFDQISDILRDHMQQNNENAAASSATAPKEEAKAANAETETGKKSKKKKPQPDALNELPGLGPSFEKKLNAEGLNSFEQLASLSDENIDLLNQKIPGFKIRYERYEWRKAAQEEIDKKHNSEYEDRE